MAESITKGNFPSQVATDLEKVSQEYGLKVAKAIESDYPSKEATTETGSIRTRGARGSK